jgi:hypothetical protein
MSKGELKKYIRDRNTGQPSVDDQEKIAVMMYDEGLVPSEDGLKRKEIIEKLEQLQIDYTYSVGTCLSNLRDVDIVRRWINGPQILIIHARRDEIVNGEDLDELVSEEIEMLIEDIRANEQTETPLPDGGDEQTMRTIVAGAIDADPSEVEEKLRSGEVPRRMDKLEDAIDAIEHPESSAEKQGDYDRIFFIHNPYQYSLTKKAVSLVENDTIDGFGASS